MGIRDISVLFPGEFVQDLPLQFVVEHVDGDIYRITGPDSMVQMTDEDHFQLNSPTVTEHPDGSFTASSA